jgi:hypothetical protein
VWGSFQQHKQRRKDVSRAAPCSALHPGRCSVQHAAATPHLAWLRPLRAVTWATFPCTAVQVVTAIEWLPHKRGFVAVACAEPLSHGERVSRMGRPTPSYILVWNFRDPIHPEYVLECPAEVFSFQYNPANPEVKVPCQPPRLDSCRRKRCAVSWLCARVVSLLNGGGSYCSSHLCCSVCYG